MKRSIVVSCGVGVFGILVACGGEKAGTDSAGAAKPADSATAASAPMRAVRIVSPAEGDSVAGPDVTIVLSAEGVTIEKAAGTRVDGVGHHHLFLDTIPSGDASPVPPTSAHSVHIGTGDSTYTFKGLAAGPHEVIAVIGFGDHVPMPARRDTVRFVVKR